MKREYDSGSSSTAEFFVGTEVEHTPAYGMLTLFVTGWQPILTIDEHLKSIDCKHIFFGANHSFSSVESPEQMRQWQKMITCFLDLDMLCSLDIPLERASLVLESGLCDFENFIPQIRVPIANITDWNYNTMIKLDDIDFRASNPGVWCHSLHDLMARDKFTPWHKYTNDTILGDHNG